jgi:hypothetical protein
VSERKRKRERRERVRENEEKRNGEQGRKMWGERARQKMKANRNIPSPISDL